MRYIKVDLSQIQYVYQNYTQSLYDSVMRIGFSFPIHVRFENGKYECVDGHKRLSVLYDILLENPNYHRGSQVTILVENSDNVRSSDCWRGRNTH